MAIVNASRIEIDITIRKFAYKGADAPKELNPELEMTEELHYKNIGLKQAIQKLIDLLPFNL